MEIMKRAVMSPKIQWKDPSQFDSFKTKLTGHFRQCHAGYLFDERFQGLYKEYGLAAVDHWCVEPGLPQLSRLQFKLDLESLMGALQSAIVASYGKLEVMKYENTQDGLSAWLEIVEKFDKGGSKRNKIKELEQVISTPYNRHYKGGLRQFIIDYENAFMELIILGESAWNNDEPKVRRLIQNLSGAGLSWLDSFTKDKTFEETCTIIRELAINKDNITREKASSKANIITSTNANLAYVDRDTWAKLPKELKDIIIKWRKEHPEEKKTQNPTKVNQANIKDQDEETQELEGYTPEQLATIDEFLNESDDSDDDDNICVNMVNIQQFQENNELYSDDDSEEDEVYVLGDPEIDWTRVIYPNSDPSLTFDELFCQTPPHSNTNTPPSKNGNTNKQSIDVLRGAELLLHLKQSLPICYKHKPNQKDISTNVNNTTVFLRGPNYKKAYKLQIDEVLKTNIIDNGADTSVIGHGWKVIAYSNRKVNVVGFDERSAVKKGLPIVTAVTGYMKQSITRTHSTPC